MPNISPSDVAQQRYSTETVMLVVNIRQADEVDLPELSKIEEDCFGSERFNTETVRAFVIRDDTFVLVAFEGNEILGSAMCIVSELDLNGKIASIAVLKQRRGTGIGAALLDECEKVFRSHGLVRYSLEVEASNSLAIALYASRGYVVKASIQDFYGAGRPAFYMEKKLDLKNDKVNVRSA
jgi:ribosomal protein S18 acetylase RimI-like enzyme